jgi:vacuolar-type H+-ATPase subunit D/Vma8
LKETMRDIVLKLEERDRFERTTLLKVKAMLM